MKNRFSHKYFELFSFGTEFRLYCGREQRVGKTFSYGDTASKT